MTKQIKIVCGEEVFAHLPNGKVQFLTFWQTIELLWWAIRNKVEIKIEDAKEDK